MKHIAFLINSTIAKKNVIVKRVNQFFSEENINYKCYFSSHKRHLEKLTQEAIAANYTYLIVVGGDGSLNEVLNGLLSASKNFVHQNDNSFKDIGHLKLGIIPLGSGNDFAKTINAKKDLEKLKMQILNDQFEACDVGMASFISTEGKPEKRFFINITDVGIGGIIAQKIIDKTKAFNADLFYLKAIFTTLISYKNTKVRFSSENDVWEGYIMSYIFANGKFFGSGLGVAPDASIKDGMLNIVRLGNISVWDYLYHLKDLKRTKFIKHKEVHYSKANHLKVEPIDKKALLIDMDGEFVGYAPLEIQCLPQVINILC